MCACVFLNIPALIVCGAVAAIHAKPAQTPTFQQILSILNTSEPSSEVIKGSGDAGVPGREPLPTRSVGGASPIRRAAMPATEDAATAVAAFVAYEARALEELAHCASAISPSLHSLLPEIANRLSTQLAAARANGAFLSQMLEDMDLLDAPSEESASDAPPPSGDEAAEAAQADVNGVLLQLRREWSEDGAEERRQSFGPMLEALARFLPSDHWSAADRGAAGGAAAGGAAAALTLTLTLTQTLTQTLTPTLSLSLSLTPTLTLTLLLTLTLTPTKEAARLQPGSARSAECACCSPGQALEGSSSRRPG